MADIFGTFGPDSTLRTSQLDRVFGLAGDDVLATTYSFSRADSGGFLMGGTGNDTYRVGAGTTTFIFDSGNDAGDRLEFPSPFFSNTFLQSTSFVEIDGRDLVITRTSRSSLDRDTGVFILDWQTSGVIEQFQDSTGTVYNFENFRQLVRSSPNYEGNFTIDEVLALSGTSLTNVGGSTAWREGMDSLLARSQQLDNPPLLYLRSGSTGENVAWLVDGDSILQGSPLEISTMPAEWQMAATGDLNSDGKDDLIWWNRNNGEMAVWFMDGTDFLGAVNLPAPDLNGGWRLAGSGDLNRDNQDDLVWHNSDTGEAVVWFMNGTSYAGSASIATLGRAWSLETVADLNGDSRDELIWRNYADGRTVSWEMDGGVIVSGADIASPVTNTSWEIRGATDFNYDGTEDILWHNSSLSETVIWTLQGSTLLGASPFVPLPSSSWQVIL